MRFFLNLAFVFTLIGSVITTSSDANSSALGCDNKQHSGKAFDPNAISVELSLPYGYLCYLVQTKREVITEQKAAYTSSAGIYAPLVDNICNWRIDFVYYDAQGNELKRDKGETVSDCKKGATRTIAKTMKLSEYGRTCAKLIVDGEPKLTQCHNISE